MARVSLVLCTLALASAAVVSALAVEAASDAAGAFGRPALPALGWQLAQLPTSCDEEIALPV